MNSFFDEAAFDTLGAEIGEADTIEVLRAFLEDTAGKMAKLAASSQDRPLIEREAHSIKSSAATFGFSSLSRMAKQLEGGAGTMDLSKLQESICELRQAFATTRQFAHANLLDIRSELVP
jgi:HPt (histidine-containing phosphotransfer) domain-containing protein